MSPELGRLTFFHNSEWFSLAAHGIYLVGYCCLPRSYGHRLVSLVWMATWPSGFLKAPQVTQTRYHS